MCDLDDHSLEFLGRLVRMELRKHLRGNRRLREKFGDEYAVADRDQRRAFMEDVYRRLGGDPDRITNLHE